MKVVILHDAVTDESSPDARDALVQAAAVGDALRALGHEPVVMPCSLDLASLARTLDRMAPDAAFNLVESLGGHGRLIHLVPALLEVLGIPFTGASAEAMYVTSGKLLTKERLTAASLPTSPWVAHPPRHARPAAAIEPGRYIVKSAWEHASIGIEDTSIVDVSDPADLPALLAGRAPSLGGECFAERFVEGREFNMSVVASPSGPRVLSPAEIVFDAFPEGKPRIVSYAAKWAEGTFEYDNTPRRFEYPDSDAPLLARIVELTRSCFVLFGLRGYARVDFRVDPVTGPQILEINANPCISPDAGFAAALANSRIPYPDAVAAILADL